MQSYTYIIINFLTIIICFIYSFDQRIQFNKHFGAFLKSSIIVAIPFIIWDYYFTKIGVWWFNDTYLLGIRVLNLPIEEILFFICIPFSCTFTYFCLTKFFKFGWTNQLQKYLVPISIIISIIVAVIHQDKLYTTLTFSVCALSLIILHYIVKVNWLGKASFIYTILMAGFLPVNGVLTGTGLESPIVNYNDPFYLTIRILTIPIEDAVYGYVMIIWNIYLFNKFNKSDSIIRKNTLK
ncbi:lycopene cyclase domain-containing protein [Faecalibacter rhinopitheci]|uniref:Lycopene cyclase domain-containing protein n=1 Tax=Faecalibacter rhinopitheci TaxID=2779678 RepID=A0A8J7FN74_9FLAO|nr:lycopene cyclase domain-containing protein [Faecalibacter rhinopitheci]MBF0596129.1 lycopene cyclase domain-containing protein [Faecalibacter rhinopitheci]